MKFEEALKLLTDPFQLVFVTRKEWPFKLYFCPNSQYLMIKYKDELTPYVISAYDFRYKWEICE